MSESGPSSLSDAPSAGRELLRHFLAAIAYRTQKALRGAPVGFGEFRAAPGVRTPRELLRHMTDVLMYARTTFRGGTERANSLPSLAREIERFHEVLEDVGRLVEEAEFGEASPKGLLQGPFADVMTHAGQLAMLRRLEGSPVPPENFIVAEIDAANLGPEQPSPRSADSEWYDAEDEPW